MYDHLKTNPDLAAAMGFDPDDLPSQSTFLPVRMEDRFSELESELNTASQEITRLAKEAGSPIGYDPLSTDEFNTEGDDSGLSKRSLNRRLRSKSKDVLDEVLAAISPNIDFDRPEETQYSDATLIEVLVFCAIKNKALNQGCESYGDKANPDCDDDDEDYGPYYLYSGG